MAKFYVYTLAYPPEMGGGVFYVGKGQGGRMHMHEVSAGYGEKRPRANVIRSIWEAGHQIVKVKVFETDDEQAAYIEEKRLITFYGLSGLTNLEDSYPRRDGPATVEKKRWRTFWTEETLRMLNILVNQHGWSPHRIARRAAEFGHRTSYHHLERCLTGESEVHGRTHDVVRSVYADVTGEKPPERPE